MSDKTRQQPQGQQRPKGAPAQLRSLRCETDALGAIQIGGAKTLAEARDMLHEEDFGLSEHGLLYRAMCQLVDAGDTDDALDDDLLVKRLERLGVATLAAIELVSPLALHAPAHAPLKIRGYCREILIEARRAAHNELAEVHANVWTRVQDEDARERAIESASAPIMARIADISRRLEGGTPARVSQGVQWARDLLRKEIAPARWAVPDLFAEGLTLFGGKSKHGKSTMILHILSAVALGGVALGKIGVEQGTALYLALEDNERRMQERLQRQLDIDDMDSSAIPDRLAVVYQWERLDVGGIAALDGWMNEHPETRIICIDTYKQVKPRQRANNMTLYDADYEALLPIQQWANRRHVAVVVVMHLKKMPVEHDPFDEISGSTGLQGVADNMVVLRKYNGEFKLHRRGRDYLDDAEWTLHGDAERLLWCIEKTEQDAALETKQSGERVALYALLDKHPEGLTPKEIAQRLNKPRSSVRIMLYRVMQQAQGNVRVKDGKYYRERVTAVTASNRVTAVTASNRAKSVTHVTGESNRGVTGRAPDAMRPEASLLPSVTAVTQSGKAHASTFLPPCTIAAHMTAWRERPDGSLNCEVCHPSPSVVSRGA